MDLARLLMWHESCKACEACQGGAGCHGGWGIYILNQIHFESFSSCQTFTYCGSPVKL